MFVRLSAAAMILGASHVASAQTVGVYTCPVRGGACYYEQRPVIQRDNVCHDDACAESQRELLRYFQEMDRKGEERKRQSDRFYKDGYR